MLEGKTISGSPQQSKASKISRNNTQKFKSRKNNHVSSSCNAINPAQRFSLLLEHCSPSPVPGPLLSPLLGGLPGNSPLTGGQAASLQLAQLKAQLALTQINNIYAVGGRAATLRANTNTPASRLSSTPPSPTAVAINLLNLLKIANTMSHPMYNPFVSGKQSSSQGQYGLSSGQTERDPRKAQPHRGSGSSFNSPGTTSLTLGTSGGPVPSPLALPVNYRPERGRITVDEDIERCLDLHISRAREEVRHQSSNQNVCFSSNQREEFSSSSTGMTPFMPFSASQGHRPSGDHGNRSLDWLPVCKRTTEEDSSKMYSSASSNFLDSGDGRFNVSSQGKCDMQSIPGLGDYDNSVSDKSAPQESSRPKYTSESASNILLHFGLEKEDLEHLIAFPEDQITPENLPFILRQIRMDKAKRVPSAVQSKPYNEPQPIPSVSGMSSRGSALNQEEISSIVLKPSKVIDYGHTGKYTGGVGEEIGRPIGSTAKIGGSGSMLHKDTFKSSSQNATEMKSGSFVSSHDQMSSITSFSSLRSAAASSNSGPTQRLETQPNQTSKPIFSSFSAMNKDVDLRRLTSDVPKSLPLKQPEPDPQSASKPQPSCTLFRGVHPGRPGLVLIGSNDESHSSNQSRTQAQASKVTEQMKNQQAQQHQAQPPQKQQQQPLMSRVLSTMKTGAPSSTTSARHPPPLMSLTTPKELFSTKVGVCKLLPTPAMMQDYAAATPRIFPHTCCLCNKECTKLKDWLAHQNTSIHLENCRFLRTRYPDWDGEILTPLSASGKDAKPSSSTSAQTSQNRQLRPRRESRSHSRSPRRRRVSEDRREKRSSRSRSRSPRRRRASEDRRQKRSSRSRSRSPRHHYGSESRRDRRSSSSRSPQGFRHSRRSRPRSLSPRTRYRSRSRSYERRSSPRRREERWFSPRRSSERRLSPRRNDDRRSSPRRSRERRSSGDRSLPQRTRSRSAEKLAKRLLETSAVQSLSKQSDLEAVVKTLAPALLAELNKIKSSSSAPSSSSSNAAKKSFSAKATKPSAATGLCSVKVRLKAAAGILHKIEITAAMEKFGKVESVTLYRSGKQAIVCFEKEKDADKVRNLKSLNVNGSEVSVLNEASTTSDKPQSTEEQKTPEAKEQKAAPQQKPAKSKAPSTKSDVSTTKSGVSTTKSGVSKTKATSTGKAKTPSRSTSGAKSTTTSKATKAKVPVSNPKAVPTKQVDKMAKTGNSNGKKVVKAVQGKKETSASPASKSTEKKPDAKDSKQKATHTKSEGNANKSAAAPAVVKSNTAAAEPNKKKKTVPEASKAGKSSATQKPKTQPEQEAVKKGKVDKKPTTSENQPKVQEATLVHKDTVKADKPPETSVKVKTEEAERVEQVGLGETGATESMEAESSTESKDPGLTDGKTLPIKPAGSPPAATSADAPQRPEATFKTEETSVKVSSIPHSESAMKNLKTKTETLEKEQQAAELSKMNQDDQFSGIKTQHDPEPAVSPEAASHAKTKTTDESANNQQAVSAVSSAPDVSSTTAEVEKLQQQEETSCVQMETVMSSTPPAKHSVHVGQPAPRDTSVSPVAAPLAGSSFSGSEKKGSADTDKKEAVGAETEVGNKAVSSKASEDVKEEQSPGTPVVSADQPTVAAAPIATVSVPDPVVSGEDAAELPLLNEDIFQAITTALHEHRLTKQSRTKSEDEERTNVTKKTSVCAEEESTQNTKAQDDAELQDNSSDVTDEPDFNFEDFVTVDEISEDMEETAVHDGSSSSKPASKEKTEKKSSDVSSKKKTSPKTSKDSKSATSASSKSTKSSSSSSSTSVSVKKQKQSSEASKSQTKASSSASSSKTSPSSSSSKSVETPTSPRQKTQSSKTKSPVKAPQASSTGRSTRSSAAAAAAAALKTSAETQQSHKAEEKPTQSAVAKSDHKVSAESNAAKTVESELKTETLEMDPPAQEHKLELTHQTQVLKAPFKDESLKEGKKSKEEKVKDSDGNLNSLEEQADEQMNKEEKEDSSTETHTPGSENDQILHLQVPVGAADDGKVCSEECSEMEVDAAVQVQESAAKTQASTADDEEEGSKVMQVSEDDVTQVAHASEKSSVDGTAELNEDKSQTPTSRAEKENKVPSDGSSQTSKDAHQVSDEDLPFKNSDSKDFTAQETLRILDSTDDQVVTEDEGQNLEAPSAHTFPPDFGSTEEEDVYQVIDSVEDQPTTTGTESETDREAGTKKSSAVERPTRSSRSRSRTSKSEDKEKSPKKQDKTVKKYETRAKDGKTGNREKTDEDTEEMVFEVVDSVEDDSVREASATESSGGRQTDGGHTEDEKTSSPIEVPEQPEKEEEMYKILDSVEDETVGEKPAVTRSTRGRKEKAKKVTENEKSTKDKTPTRRRNTPARELHEKEREKTPKANANVSSKESTPTKKSDAVRDTSEEEATYEILDAVEEDDQPTPPKPKRGRPKRDSKSAKKQTAASKKSDLPSKGAEEEEAATYQILDSVDDGTAAEQTTDQTENTGTSVSATDDSKTKKSPMSPENKEEEEPMYQIVDSLDDDQFQEELMTEVSSVQEEEKREAEEKMAANVDSVEALKEADVEKGSLLLEVKVDPSAEVGGTSQTAIKGEEESLTESSRGAAKSKQETQKETKKKPTTSKKALVSLDDVSEEEEDYPDDTAEEEALKTRQAAGNDREERRTRESRERRSRSSSRARGSGETVKKPKEMCEENQEAVEAESQELVTLDEVGEDEAAEGGVTDGPKFDVETGVGDLQELLTLDEIVEEEEDGMEALEPRPLSHENQSVDSLKTEMLSALDEGGQADDKNAEKEEINETSGSVKRKHDENTEDSEDFVTLDEVGGTEEEEKKAATATRGRPKKKGRQTPVRKSARGKIESKEHTEGGTQSAPAASPESSSTSDKDSSTLSGDAQLEIQKTESKSDVIADQQPQSESPDEQKPEGGVMDGEEGGQSRVEVKVADKRRAELIGPEAKRPRSQSPSCADDFQLPPFNPKKPQGQEFVVPKSGFFCNLCSMFYLSENTAKKTHCSSQKHYNNLLKHYQTLQGSSSRSSTQSSLESE